MTVDQSGQDGELLSLECSYTPSTVAAIIVLFHPDWAQTASQLKSLASQTSLILLVDNTPEKNRCPLPLKKGIIYLPLHVNKGIAYAQNIGVAECALHGADKFILLDQDSEVDDDLVPRLLSGFAELKRLGHRVGAIGPRPFDTHRQAPHIPLFSVHQAVASRFSKVSHLISSGSLISQDAFRAVGPFDESLFIDSVDQEWCWRAAAKGWHCFVDESVSMRHCMGRGAITVLGLKVSVSAPPRLYYQFRNTIRLMLHFKGIRIPFSWYCKRVVALPAKFFLNALLLPNHLARIRYMVAGIRDGVANRGGSSSVG